MSSQPVLAAELAVTDLQMQAYIDMRAHLFGHDPTSVKLLREADDASSPQDVILRFLHPGGASMVVSGPWTGGPGQYFFNLLVADLSDLKLIDQLVAFGEAKCRELKGAAVRAWPLSIHPAILEAYDRAGWKRTQEQSYSILNPQEFEAAQWEDRIHQVVKAGYALRPLADHMAENEVSSFEKLYHLIMELDKDIPMPYEMPEPPFEDFLRFEQINIVDHPTWIIASKGEEWVGISMLSTSRVDRSLAHTGLTGVRREHRRIGLAAAMKAKAIEQARLAGIVRINTENEENNPMLDLNRQLGFQEAWREIGFERKLEA